MSCGELESQRQRGDAGANGRLLPARLGIQVADVLCTSVRLAFCAPDGSEVQRLTLRFLEPMYKHERVAGGVTITPSTMARMAAARTKTRRPRDKNLLGSKST